MIDTIGIRTLLLDDDYEIQDNLVHELLKEIDNLRGALQFYANGDHYHAMSGVIIDVGQVARNAFKEST